MKILPAFLPKEGKFGRAFGWPRRIQSVPRSGFGSGSSDVEASNWPIVMQVQLGGTAACQPHETSQASLLDEGAVETAIGKVALSWEGDLSPTFHN